MPEENKDLVIKLFKCFDEGDFQAGRALLHKDFREQGTSDTIDEFIERRKGFYRTFPDGTDQFEHVVAEGNLVATTGSISGTHRNTFMGVAPTGKRVSMRVWHLHRVAQGKIIEHGAVAELHVLMRELGVAPA